MSRSFTPILLVLLVVSSNATFPQDETKSRSQQDILRERARACKGLKGQAMSECQAGYVGPRDEKAGTGGWRRPPNPQRGPGRA